ncbi:hypothetical protein CPJCM30710_11680 [Clostridium polyendosporum]|uniref:Uncharacterized protein n=1 Tax=Clostridium polyendosporum TaxID=69208 RepID=A0A919VFT8_9CLOT|nr:HAD family hydrolase [Clostridium polyendosporum]GIM28502.1 hypothetical protein CPJCM30710_11680 [Clostridium polyendosporum]
MRTYRVQYNDYNDEFGTIIYIAIDKSYSGYIIISDEIKENSKQVIKRLKKKGVKKIAMLTTNDRKIAKFEGGSLG